MLLQFKVITQKNPPNIAINLEKQNQTLNLEKSASNKFHGEVVINNDEKIQYIIGNTIAAERQIKYEKDGFMIINDNLEKMRIVQGIKEITFVLGKLTLWPYVPFVCGSISELGNWNPENAQMMVLDGDKWYLTISASRSFEYKFILNKILGNEVQWESTPNRTYDILTSPECVEIETMWEKQTKCKRLKRNPKFVHMTIHYKTNSQRDRLIIVGNTASLGFWDPQHGKAMQRYLDYNWCVGLIIDENEIEFKFVVVTGEQCIWEDGENRILELDDRQSYSIVAFWNFQNKSRIHSREYDIDCPICSQHLKDQTIRIGQLCGHLICSKCYQQMSSNTYLRVKCPICRKPFQL